MEIKATLNKPYTDSEKLNFIVVQNHQLGYEIRETETALQSFGKTLEEELILAKAFKEQENISKAQNSIQEGFVVFQNAQFETNTQTCSDLLSAMLIMQSTGAETTSWLSKDDKVVQLTADDFKTLCNLIAVYKNNIWNNKYIGYKNRIEQATTIKELEKIVIDYSEGIS